MTIRFAFLNDYLTAYPIFGYIGFIIQKKPPLFRTHDKFIFISLHTSLKKNQLLPNVSTYTPTNNHKLLLRGVLRY